MIPPCGAPTSDSTRDITLPKLIKEHATEYYASKNFNFWYVFGVIAMVALVMQIITGLFLTMNYKPSAEEAFASVEYIMRDVEWGWLIRYMHSTGASAFFIVIYLHMFRAMLYGSYKKPRELIWIIGMLIFFVLMAETFAGYLLPWGQMSYWGAQVIISLFGAIPVIGESLVEYIRGDYSISDITLNRFFALHVIALPLALIGRVEIRVLQEIATHFRGKEHDCAEHHEVNDDCHQVFAGVIRMECNAIERHAVRTLVVFYLYTVGIVRADLVQRHDVHEVGRNMGSNTAVPINKAPMSLSGTARNIA